jgi:hypothetical protein
MRRLQLSPGRLAGDGKTPCEKGDVFIVINRGISKENARGWSTLDKAAQQSSDDGRFCADENSRASAATDDTQSKTVKTLTLRQLNTPTYLTARIVDRVISSLLDSGSEVCPFPSDVVRNFDLQPAGQSLYAANGTTISISGYVRVPLCVGSETFVVDGLVSEHAHEAILGANFLSENRALWDLSLGVLSLRRYNFKLCGPVARSWCRRLIVAEPVEVPARSEAVLNGYVVFNGKIAGRQPDNTAWATEPAKLADGVHVASVLVPSRATDVPVRVINTSDQAAALPAGRVLANLSPVTVCDGTDATAEVTHEPLPAEQLQAIQRVLAGIDSSVSDVVRRKLEALLIKYRAAFSYNENDLGLTDLIKHRILTGNAVPIRQRVRRQPPLHQAVIDKQILIWLEQGVIEKAQSPWSANLVVVRRGDSEKFRVCADFRSLNDCPLNKDAYALPKVDQCIDSMAGGSWFSVFDCKDAYMNVEIDPEDRPKTAISCRSDYGSQFQFSRMAYGLTFAGVTFQRLVELVLAGLNYHICLCYLDNIISWASTPEQMLEKLELILEKIVWSGLKLKPAKTFLMQKEISFLGYRISERGIEPHPDKIALVRNWPEPRNAREIRTIVGMASDYHIHIKGFSEVVSALTDLLRKNVKFEFGDAARQAFAALKLALTSPPVLAMPIDGATWIADCDASNTSIGCVVSQIQDGVERVIAYGSKKLSRREQNWPITKRETYAVVYFLKNYRYYLLGAK